MIFEIGIEKEYALLVETEGSVCYLLAADVLLEALENRGYLPPDLRQTWEALQRSGWKVLPEYSNSLLEVVSPPALLSDAEVLVEGFRQIEVLLTHLVEYVGTNIQFKFECLTVSSSASSITDQFIDLSGNVQTDFGKVLLNAQDAVPLLTLLESCPPLPSSYQDLETAARLYAGFTSTHLTVHPVGLFRAKDQKLLVDEEFAQFYWISLQKALEIEASIQKDGRFYKNGNQRFNFSPDSPRDFLLDWSDAKGTMIKTIARLSGDMSVTSAVERFLEVFGAGPYSDSYFKSIPAYAARPRVFQGNVLIEYRCFHGMLDAAGAVEAARQILKATHEVGG